MDERLTSAVREVLAEAGPDVLAQPDRFRNMLADALGAERGSLLREQSHIIDVVERLAISEFDLPLDPADREPAYRYLAPRDATEAAEAQEILDALSMRVLPSPPPTAALSESGPLKNAVEEVIATAGLAVLSDRVRFRNMLADALGPRGAESRAASRVLVILVEEGVGTQIANHALTGEEQEALLERIETAGVDGADAKLGLLTLETAVAESGRRIAPDPHALSADAVPGPVSTVSPSRAANVTEIGESTEDPDPLRSEGVRDFQIGARPAAGFRGGRTSVDGGTAGQVESANDADRPSDGPESGLTRSSTVMSGIPRPIDQTESGAGQARRMPRLLVFAAVLLAVLTGGLALVAGRGDDSEESAATTAAPETTTTSIDSSTTPSTDPTNSTDPPPPEETTPTPSVAPSTSPPTQPTVPPTPPPTPPPTVPPPTVTITPRDQTRTQNQSVTFQAASTNSTSKQWSDSTGQCSGGSSFCTFTCQTRGRAFSIAVTVFGPGGQASDVVTVTCT